MPDIVGYMQAKISGKYPILLEGLPPVVAEAMSCKVPAKDSPPGNPGRLVQYNIDPDEVGVFISYGSGFVMKSKQLVVLEVHAIPHDDRMRSIENRLDIVAEWVRRGLRLPAKSVAIKFRPVPDEHWRIV